MNQKTTLTPASKVPHWLAPDDARKLLHSQIEEFVMNAACGAYDPDTDAPALAMKVTAGLGKTATALHVIAEHAEALLTRGHVLFYVATLELAERACDDFRRIAPMVPSRVLRGRAALRPDDSKMEMCEQAELAAKISGFVPSVTQALCRAEDPNGNFVQSKCAAGCPYLEQKDVAGAHVVFLSHAYLLFEPPIDRNINVTLRVIDEKVWPTLKRRSQQPLEEFMQVPSATFPENLRDPLALAKGAIIDGLQRSIPLHDHLRASGLTPELLAQLAAAEGKSQTLLDIAPWQDAAAISFKRATFDEKVLVASRRRQTVLSRAAEKENGHCNAVCLIERTVNGATRQLLEASNLEQLPRDAPVLLLDADADPDITERVAPGALFSTIQSPPIADIIQVSDLVMSTSWLLDQKHGKARRARVLEIIKREVIRADEGGVLIVATKKVLWQLHGDAGQPVSEHFDPDLQQPLLGAMPRWFGPKTQGVNDFEGYATVIIIGRLQPQVCDLESSARAVFGSDDAPLITHNSGPLPAFSDYILMSDGSEHAAALRTHPDPRTRSILAQSRECATLQAIARLRLVTPNRSKRVLILSNLPLPEFPITKLVLYHAISRGLENEPDIQRFLRLEAALRATMGQTVIGTRLSALGLTTDLPLGFRSSDAAAKFRRGLTTTDLVALCKRVANANGWPITPLKLKRSGGGISATAIVLTPPSQAFARAIQLWPDCTPSRT